MTIKKITEEQLEITTEKKEIVNKTDLENRKESLLRDKQNTEDRIVEVDNLLANFTSE